MSYAAYAIALKTALESDTTLSAYNYVVNTQLGEDQSDITNAEFVVEIQVPDGTYIEPQNDISSMEDSGNSEFDTERYYYRFVLRTNRKGLTDRFELSSLAGEKTIFDFEKEVRNALDANWKIDDNVTDFEYSGPVTFDQSEGQGNFKVYFDLMVEEQIEVTNR